MTNLVQHDKNVIAQHFAKLGRKGGKLGGPARARKLSAKKRRQIARKASAAAAAARKSRAVARKATQ